MKRWFRILRIRLKKLNRSRKFKIFSNLVLSSISVILFFLLLALISLYIASNYKIFLKDYGIDVRDDCKFEGKGFKCSFIEVKSKDFDFKLSEVSADFYPENIFTTDYLVNLRIESFQGVYTNDLKAPPSKKIKGLLQLYFFTNYVKTELKILNLLVKNVEEDTDLTIDADDIHNQKNVIITKNLSSEIRYKSDIYKIEGDTKNTKLEILPDRIKINDLKAFYKDVFLSIKYGTIYEDKFVNLDGNLELKDISKDGLNIGNLSSSYSFNYAPNKKLYLNLKSQIKNISYDKDKFISKLATSDLEIDGKDFNNFKIKGKLNLSDNSILAKKSVKDILLSFKGRKEKFLKLEGSIYSQILKGEFSFKDDILNFSTSPVNIADYREFLPDLNLNGEAVIKATVDIDKKIVRGSADLKRFSVLDFKNLDIQTQLNYERDTVNLKSFVRGQDLNIDLSGKIDKLSADPYLDLDIFLSTLRLYSIPEIKKLDIDGLISGRGKIFGKLEDINVNLTGTAKTFRYQDINLTNLSYTFNYKNNTIQINSNLPDNSLISKVNIDLDKSTTDIYLKANNFTLKPVENFLAKELPFIKDFKPYQTSGDIAIKILHHGFDISLNLNNTKIYPLNFKEPIILSIYGNISDKQKNLYIEGKAQRLTIDDNLLENLNMKVSVINSDVKYSLKSSFKVSQASGVFLAEGYFDTDKKILNGTVLADGDIKTESKTIPVSFNYKMSGSLDNLQMKGKFSVEKSVMDMTGFVKSSDGQVYRLNFTGSPFSYKLDGLSIDVGGIHLQAEYNKQIENPIKGYLEFVNISVIEKSYPVVKLPQLLINFDKNKIYGEKTTYSGIFSGKLEEAVYSLKDNNLKILINGNIDREYLSEFLQFINLDGNLKFVFSFNGKIQDFTKNYNLVVSGENLRLRTPYTQGTVMLEDFNIKTKENVVVNIKGKTKSSFGDAYATINGISNLNFDTVSFNIKSENFPMRYKNIFTGILNSDVKINSKKKDITIDATSQLTGRAKIEPDIFENQEPSGEKPEIFKKIKLNINLSTLSPIFLEGSWGKAYLDGNVVITGTAEKPILNGKLNISYGKVVLMRNIYNIDFINVKITNNDIYVNGRLSTFVSGTNIFVNVSGPSNNLRYDFFSTPPKSKEEILTLLLLKKTPEQLTSSGIFTVLGKVGEMLIPFKVEEEEKGLFGTGVNLNIIPSYSPVQGIVFSVYLQKYLTRRIYLGLSRPISNYQSYNYLGWYEAGFKLTERTSFVIKTYENRSRSGEITFTLPFDF